MKRRERKEGIETKRLGNGNERLWKMTIKNRKTKKENTIYDEAKYPTS